MSSSAAGCSRVDATSDDAHTLATKRSRHNEKGGACTKAGGSEEIEIEKTNQTQGGGKDGPKYLLGRWRGGARPAPPQPGSGGGATAATSLRRGVENTVQLYVWVCTCHAHAALQGEVGGGGAHINSVANLQRVHIRAARTRHRPAMRPAHAPHLASTHFRLYSSISTHTPRPRRHLATANWHDRTSHLGDRETSATCRVARWGAGSSQFAVSSTT